MQTLRQNSLVDTLLRHAARVHAWFLPRSFETFDVDTRRKTQTMIWAMLTMPCALLPLAFANWALGLTHAVACLLLTLPPLLSLVMLRWGFTTLAMHNIMFLGMLGIDALVLVSGGPVSSSSQWLVLIPILALALLPPRAGLCWMLVVLLNQMVLLHLFSTGVYTSTLRKPGQEFAEFGTNFVVAPMVAAMLSYWLMKIRDSMTSRLQKMEAEVRLVLDNVPTGLLVVGRDGRFVSRPSPGVSKWLGNPQPGDALEEVLYERAPSQAMSFCLAFDALVDEALPVELLLEQMPKWWSANGFPHRVTCHLVFDEPDRPWTQLAISVQDARQEIERESAEAERDSLAAIVRLLQSEREAFLDFIEESDRLIERLQTDVTDDGWLRALHTLKGNAGVFGLTRLSQLFHTAELLALAGDRESALKQTLRTWFSWRNIFDELVGEGGFDGVRIDDHSYRDFVANVEAEAPHTVLLHSARLWTYQPVRRALERVGSRAAAVAARLGKPSPIVVVDTSDLRVDRDVWRPLWAAMIHLVRNAVDHGFESVVDRRRANKSAQGRLTLRAWLNEDCIVLDVTDDGAGIDWECVRLKASALGLPTAGGSSIDWLIADGVTTRNRVDEVSGRGVGLAALAESVAALDGQVSVTSSPGEGTEWRITIPQRRMHPASESRATRSAVLRAMAA